MSLALASACSVNRHILRIETQGQLLNVDLASRQRKMDSDFEFMTQLAQHSAETLEAVSKRVEVIKQALATSSHQEEFAKQLRQVELLRSSAQELNKRMAEMEARASAMKEFQYGMFRSAAVPNQRSDAETANTTPKETDQ
jgi:hypothetical protein